MRARLAVLLAALGLLAAAAYLAGKPGHRDEEAAERSATRKPVSSEDKLAALPPPTAEAFARAAARRATLFGEYALATSYRALYDRLKGSAEGSTAEGLYVLYQILHRCATVTGGPVRRKASAKSLDQRRREFLDALAPDDPQRDKRIAAFERVAVDKCAGFEDVKATQAELDALLDAAAAAGDPKAKARAIERDIWQARAGSQWGTATLSAAQVGTLEQAVQTKDPEAMRLAGQLLSDPWPDVVVRLGPEQQPVEARAFYNSWQMLSCDYGSPSCGPGSERLLDPCAYQGHCDAASLPEFLYYYGSTPHEAELMTQYESVLRAGIETGDWSQLVVTHGTRVPGTGFPVHHGAG